MAPALSRPPALAGVKAWLSPACSLKLLEEPAVYNRANDELYFVSDEAFAWLRQAAAGGAPLPAGPEAREFFDYCLEEQLIATTASPTRQAPLKQSPVPSPRYLLLHVTDRCNLRCRHCFQGEAGAADMAPEQVELIINEFEAMQGLRLIISGGEPLLHPRFAEINELLAGRNLRRILLTNGCLIDAAGVSELNFDEVQVSIDGLEPAHDWLRGRGSFRQAFAGALLLRLANVELSVATMVHDRNLDDFDALDELIRTLGAREWSVDHPSRAGRLLDNEALLADPSASGPLLERSFGGAVHEPHTNESCGVHLMAVMADGSTARCGFYAASPTGHVDEGLAACWKQSRVVAPGCLPEECSGCRHLAECRGGCRFRASGYNDPPGPDACQCSRYEAVGG